MGGVELVVVTVMMTAAVIMREDDKCQASNLLRNMKKQT
jgi:hypothetical protein